MLLWKGPKQKYCWLIYLVKNLYSFCRGYSLTAGSSCQWLIPSVKAFLRFKTNVPASANSKPYIVISTVRLLIAGLPKTVVSWEKKYLLNGGKIFILTTWKHEIWRIKIGVALSTLFSWQLDCFTTWQSCPLWNF